MTHVAHTNITEIDCLGVYSELPGTMREIAQKLQITQGSVRSRLEWLKKCGKVKCYRKTKGLAGTWGRTFDKKAAARIT